MSIISRMRKQKCVLWTKSGNPTKEGLDNYDAPIEIDCRWDDRAVRFIDPDGKEKVSRAVVYPDRALKPGDRLLESLLADITGSDPFVNKSNDVKQTAKTPNLKATETLHTAYL